MSRLCSRVDRIEGRDWSLVQWLRGFFTVSDCASKELECRVSTEATTLAKAGSGLVPLVYLDSAGGKRAVDTCLEYTTDVHYTVWRHIRFRGRHELGDAGDVKSVDEKSPLTDLKSFHLPYDVVIFTCSPKGQSTPTPRTVTDPRQPNLISNNSFFTSQEVA